MTERRTGCECGCGSTNDLRLISLQRCFGAAAVGHPTQGYDPISRLVCRDCRKKLRPFRYADKR